MRSIRIDPDGTVTPHDKPALDASHEMFDATSVVTCRAPVLAPYMDGDFVIFVGVIDDFGAQDQPLNEKAWACYGRSPIYGTMFLGIDGGSSVGLTELTATLTRSIEDWVDAAVLAIMRQPQERPEMMTPRPPS